MPPLVSPNSLPEMVQGLIDGKTVILARSAARLAMLTIERWCSEAVTDFNIEGTTVSIRPIKIELNETGRKALRANDQV